MEKDETGSTQKSLKDFESIESKKKGGPYPKKEQEKRRKQVYALHFEKGFSAVSIADELHVNRNTINEDIKYWLMEIASQFEDQDLGGIVLKQIERLEIQRKRLLEQLDEIGFDEKLRVEKMLFELDHKITDIVSKIAEKKISIEYKPKNEISYKEASEILKKIIFSERIIYPESISDEKILKEIVISTKCDSFYADEVFLVLENMGLDMFLDEEESDFDLISFATAKDLLSTQETEALEQKLKENKKKQEQRASVIKKKYEEKYGTDPAKWAYGIMTQMKEEIKRF